MAGQRPVDRYNAGFKIGSSSNTQRPISGDDLIIIDDASEPATTESVRVGTISDIFTDLAGASGVSQTLTLETDIGIVTLTFSNGLLTGFTSDNGTGTIDDPYLVATPAQLYNVRNDLTAYYRQTANIALTDYQAGEGWEPIGADGDTPFTGVYDGGGHKITAMVINSSRNDAGLFGYINGGTVQDLTIETADVTGVAYVGVLVGRTVGATITDVIVSGTAAGATVGGLAASAASGDITTSSADVDVTGTGTGGCGGLLGTGYPDISQCYAMGDVLGTAGSAGGLVGSYGLGGAQCSIQDSYANGAVSATANNSGGLIGETNGGTYNTIKYSYAMGAVSHGTNMGGLIGADSNLFTDPACVSCYWDITINSGLSTPNFGAVGMTTADMKAMENYTDWNFTSTWDIDEGNDYPRLQWETP